MFSNRLPQDLSQTSLFKELEVKNAMGVPILDLTNSNPTTAGIPGAKSGVFKTQGLFVPPVYSPDPRGLDAARLVICSYYKEKGISLSSDNIFLTASTSEAYSMLFKLFCNPGEAVLCPRPSYPLLAPLAELDAVELVYYDLVFEPKKGWLYDYFQIEKALTVNTKAVIIVSPNNPTGSILDILQRQKLQKLCAAKGLALIVDEVFLDYSDAPLNTAVKESESLTFVLSGCSKVLALPQLKLSWIAANGPEGLLRRASLRLEHILDVFLSVSGPVQAAAEALFRERHALQSAVCERLKHNALILEKCIEEIPGLQLIPGSAGWSAVLMVNTGKADSVLASHLLEQYGVFLHPGYLFDFPGENYLVISLLIRPAILKKGLEALADTLDKAASIPSVKNQVRE